jgi:hypothetical protein
MSHAEGTDMTERYGDWFCSGLDDDDAVVSDHQDDLDGEMLLLETIIDRGW